MKASDFKLKPGCLGGGPVGNGIGCHAYQKFTHRKASSVIDFAEKLHTEL